MTKDEAKAQIQLLVSKYETLASQNKIKTFNEAQTRNEFIEPLFEALGWDMRNLHNEIDEEVFHLYEISGEEIRLIKSAPF